jgi:hypothetical protein
MKKNMWIILFSLLGLTGCSTEVVTPDGVNFWTNHTIWQLLGWLFFPRIMFWFFSAMTGGFFFWLGVFFVPRIMVAFWATVYYWDTNPILCIFAWIYALTGEMTEKTVAGGA